jgi:hypothetical protein
VESQWTKTTEYSCSVGRILVTGDKILAERYGSNRMPQEFDTVELAMEWVRDDT